MLTRPHGEEKDRRGVEPCREEEGERERECACTVVGKRERRERRVSNTGYQYLHAFEHVHGILIQLRDSIDQVKHLAG